MASTVDKVLVSVTKTTTGESYYSGPASGKVWVVKDIAAHYDSYSGPMEVALFTRRSAANWNITDRTNQLPNPDAQHWSGWRVLEFGDVLGVYMSHTANLHVWASGTEITP